MKSRFYYMDNAATSFPKPEVVYEAMDHFNRNMGGNPGRGSNHQTLEASSVVMEARDHLADLFNIQDSLQIAFTSNVTEAINMALKGLLKSGDHVITTSLEHNAVARPLYLMSQQGIEWTRVSCTPCGELDPEEIRRSIRPNTRLICMLHASNVMGSIMPIREAGKIAREHGVLFMVDAAQTAGVLPIDVEDDGIDILCFTGHKALLGPQGTGGIYIRPGFTLQTVKEGGTGSSSEDLEHPFFMPDHLEAGTLNTPGIAGLLAGVRFIEQEGLATIRDHEKRLSKLLMEGLLDIPGIKLYGPGNADKQTAVIAFNVQGMDCGEVSLQLDYDYNIVTRAGLHCAPLAHTTLGTLEEGACRLSWGYFSTKEEIEYVIKAVADIAARE